MGKIGLNERSGGPRLLGSDPAAMFVLADNHRLHCFAPINTVDGRGAYQDQLLDPLRAAFPHGEERSDIRLAGQYQGGDWVASSGHIAGLFEADRDRSLTLRHFQHNDRPIDDSGQEVLKHVARLWGFGVHLESTNNKGEISKRWSVGAPAA